MNKAKVDESRYLRLEFANLKTYIEQSINSSMRYYIVGASMVCMLLKALYLFVVR